MAPDLPVIIQTHELYDSISKITEKLPSLKRQTIGRRLEDSTLKLLELLIMAKNAPKAHKAVYLIQATATAEIIQFFIRSLMAQKLVNQTTLHQLAAKTDEIARMATGWCKSVQ
ncbi:four helix bundle protein [Candidatus Saccharibacteria bacterium]|nr:four helix bundle protein [Candidatus Saccharibacteria bacterium]